MRLRSRSKTWPNTRSSETTAMVHQVTDQDLGHLTLAADSGAFRQIEVHRLVKSDASGLYLLHQRDPGEGLRDGADPEHRPIRVD